MIFKYVHRLGHSFWGHVKSSIAVYPGHLSLCNISRNYIKVSVCIMIHEMFKLIDFIYK